jgi:predicted enzyme related to lactoylglutathione lyase
MDFQIMTSLPAHDVGRARDWYARVLGAEPTMDDVGGGSLIYARDDGGFMLYESAFAGTNKATAAAIGVPNLDAAMAELRASGVAFEDVEVGEMSTDDGVMTFPDGQRMAWFKDSEGNILGIGELPS